MIKVKSAICSVLKETSLLLFGILAVVAIQRGTGYLLRVQPSGGIRASQDKQSVTLGAKVRLKGAPSNSLLHVVLVVSPSCRYCVKSAPFHSALLRLAREENRTMYVAVPSVGEASGYLASSSLDSARVITWDELGIEVRATPTLIVTDGSGTIKRAWVGVMGDLRQKIVLDIVRDPSRLERNDLPLLSGEASLTDDDLANLERRARVRVIDVRDRDAFTRSPSVDRLNIPLAELPVRAAYELDGDTINVIDCANVPANACAKALKTMSDLGYGGGALNPDRIFENQCAVTRVARDLTQSAPSYRGAQRNHP